MRVVLVGHSHSIAIASALDITSDPQLTNLAACCFEHVYLRRDPYHGLLRDRMARHTQHGRSLRQKLTAAEAAVLSLEGGWHDFGMVERRDRFDFFGGPGEASPKHGRQLIPRRLLEEYFDERMNSTTSSAEGVKRSSFVEVLTFVREHLDGPAVLLESPPPVPDEEKIAKYRQTIAVSKHGVPPIAIRHKLWRLQCSLMRLYCERAGVDYIAVPKQVLDPDGILVAKAYEGVDDPTHMGSWYGQCVLKQVDTWLGLQLCRRQVC